MSNETIIRAWKDKTFRDSLTDAERAMLPPNPAGLVELLDSDLLDAGGATAAICITLSVVTVVVSIQVTIQNSCLPAEFGIC